ncbi:hypothetical protein OPU71_06005 [Niveibacterium sp. 24ML]|uniref:hypothetical protein n=1 Tax=Niveibacterium sp. 24ML TaxID=2985512 RepID=UPI00226F964E|nr:hypothetical protein [Niveibacterium sp. 24ML]MCX9155677.1 hypothetical protein [Niveibacterium sp. 24ML]
MAVVTPEQILDDLCDSVSEALRDGYLKLVSYGKGQARRESTENEEKIGSILQATVSKNPLFKGAMTFSVAQNGSWYDFLVESGDGGIWLPINLKVSSLRGNDNVASKAGLYYAMTGQRPANAEIANWEVFFQNLAANLKREGATSDYYFLVVEKSKKGVGRVFWTSLLKLCDARPNGSNPPFQAKWSANIERSSRSRSEAVDYLLNVVGQTFVLRARALDSFKKHVVPCLSTTVQTEWSGDGPEVEGEVD